jgi:hypothetical protein
MIVTAAQRMMISTALGPGVMQAVDLIQFHLNTYGKTDGKLWRDLLQALHDGAGDEAMGSPLGLALQMAIHGRIQNGNDDSASERRPKPGGGFPNRR